MAKKRVPSKPVAGKSIFGGGHLGEISCRLDAIEKRLKAIQTELTRGHDAKLDEISKEVRKKTAKLK